MSALHSRLTAAVTDLETLQSIPLEVVARTDCPTREVLIGMGLSAEDQYQRALSRMTDEGMARMVQNYLQRCYGKRFHRGGSWSLGSAHTIFLGILDGIPVDFAMVEHSEFSVSAPPAWAVACAAFKATRYPKKPAEKILLICLDRDKQDWNAFSIHGDLEKVARSLDARLDRLKENWPGQHENVCSKCEVNQSCPQRGKWRETLLVNTNGVVAVPENRLIQELDSYLWGLNDRHNGRTRGVIHPSDIATTECDRLVAYGILSTDEQEKIDPKLRRIFDQGHVIHDIIQRALGVAYEDFEAEVRVIDMDLGISGSCDGSVPSLRKVMEIKSIGLNGYEKLKSPKKEHQAQATIYGVKLDAKDIAYIYVCKGLSEITCFEMSVDRGTWHKIAARATTIKKTVDAGELPPKLKNKDRICRACKYGWTCRPDLQQQRGFKR